MTNKGFAVNMNTDHEIVMNTMHKVALTHLAKALFREGDFLEGHVIAARTNLEAYLVTHRERIPRTENDWEANTPFKRAVINAILTDTLGRVQDEITGHDDSWGDYMPDGLSQAQALTDDGYDGNGFVWYVMNSYTISRDGDLNEYLDLIEERADHILDTWGCTMQDCTSDILTTLAKVHLMYP